MELDLEGRFLSTLCDCDVFTRWICQKCVRAERIFTNEYHRDRTSPEYYDEDWAEAGPTKEMIDHQFSRWVWSMSSFTVSVAPPYHKRVDHGAPGVSVEIRQKMNGIKSIELLARRCRTSKMWAGPGLSIRPLPNLLIPRWDPRYPPYIGKGQPYPKLAYTGPI
ncbi:hypothetical protein CLAFUW4_08930 [Fulvia fulva]|nr:hypothetical protein CLAFUR4_08936 [Fulvia fulva]KAK4614912.1 hypothetical protein CLAFUR0_08928 [Fulvia fulva]WPV20545.1 hypothetical protein CLAFUW4_08930 [Fulvia fulva]WPV35166.1 hypothetical protein CLAFUW7_08931 [Fulvia fulva]